VLSIVAGALMSNIFIGSTPDEQREMLEFLGFPDLEALYGAVVPPGHMSAVNSESLGNGITEDELKALMGEIAGRNSAFNRSCFAGAGFYQRTIPEAVFGITSSGDWGTPYTPYQPEIAQGILTTLFDFQSYIAALTGMAVVNAGLYNGPNAMAEAALMALRITKRSKVLVSDSVSPVAMRNLQTYLAPKRGLELVVVPTEETGGVTSSETIERLVDDRTAAVIVQNPNFWGRIDGMDGQAAAAHSKNALYVVYGGGDQVSLAMLGAPAEYGADIYAGEGQHFGIPVAFGGPHVGILAIARDDRQFLNQLPGRLVGECKDADGNRRFMLVLQPREQHIRRENATSNTCTAETLISVMCTAYLAIMGRGGLRQAAEKSYRIANHLADNIQNLAGFRILYPDSPYFNEFAVATPVPAAGIVDELARDGLLAGVPVARTFPYAFAGRGMENVLLVSATEANDARNSKGRFMPDKLLDGLSRYAR